MVLTSRDLSCVRGALMPALVRNVIRCYLVMELVGGKARTLCGIWFQAFFTVGMLYDSLVAYVAQTLHGNWMIIQIAAGLPTLLYIPYFW